MNTWGSLKTYYLVVYMDTGAETFKLLDKPKRMMFTIAAAIDSPTVKAKINRDGNVTLYWDPIEGAESYKIYRGSAWLMSELARTDKTEFVLDSSNGYGMNSLLSDMSEYAVVAVKGSEESRLSNLIKGEDYARIAPMWIEDEQDAYDADKISIMELPREVNIKMVDFSTIKTYPVIWDFENPEKTDYGMYVFYGKIPGTI